MQKSRSDPAVVNPKTGKAERVFVNLEAVYPNEDDPSEEFSFEELRAMSRGWAARDWKRRPASPLRMISINIQPSPVKGEVDTRKEIEELSHDVDRKLILDNENSSDLGASAGKQAEAKDTKVTKPKRIKIREVKQEVQTGKYLSA